MKKLYYFFVKSGKILFIWTMLAVISISLQSFINKGKVNYGERCYQNFDDKFIVDYQVEGIKLESNKLECNTYYLIYNSTINEKENLTFLVSIAKLFYDNNIDSNVHIIIKNQDYQILSTIVDYKVSYTKSII